MRYRPLSSVTTILMYLVGSSLVSAITQTPASCPLELVTTPPISVFPTRTVLALPCPAFTGAVSRHATATMPTTDSATPDQQALDAISLSSTPWNPWVRDTLIHTTPRRTSVPSENTAILLPESRS